MELGEIFDRHWQRVWRAAYAVSGDRELASDAAQDAFIRAGAALHRFDRRRPVEPWLVRIAVNRATDLVRTRRREAGEGELPETFTLDPSPPDEALHGALRRLDPKRRAVIALHVARTRVLASRAGRPRRLVWALAAAVLAAGAFGVGYAVASGGKPKPKIVVEHVPARLNAGPGFLPAPGWTVQGSTATSGSGIRVDATFQPASMVPGLPTRLLPLQLPPSGRRRAHVGAYAVEVTVTYPEKPSRGQLVAAREEVRANRRPLVPHHASHEAGRRRRRDPLRAPLAPGELPGVGVGSRRGDRDCPPRARHAALRGGNGRLRRDRRIEQLRGRRRSPARRQGEREPVGAHALRREDLERLGDLGTSTLVTGCTSAARPRE